MENYTVGSIVKGEVTGIEPYGIFVKVDECNQSRYNALFNKASALLGLSSPISNISDYFRELPNIITKASEKDGEIW